MSTTGSELGNLDELPTLSPAQRQVAGVLAEIHDATIIEITAAAGVSKSTVAKTLTVLETAAAARRTVHTDGEIRMADTWSPTPLTGVVLMTTATRDKASSGNAAMPPAVTDVAEELDVYSDAAEDSASCDDGQAEETFEAVDAAQDLGVAATDEAVERSVPAPPPASNSPERLAPGGLAEMVAAALAAHPDIDYSPTMLSHLLNGRSSGAIANALERMVVKGTAVRTCEAPKRYRHVHPAAESSS